MDNHNLGNFYTKDPCYNYYEISFLKVIVSERFTERNFVVPVIVNMRDNGHIRKHCMNPKLIFHRSGSLVFPCVLQM